MFHIQTLNKISLVGLNKFDPANYTVDAQRLQDLRVCDCAGR